MDIAVTSTPMGSSETQHRSYNALHLNSEHSPSPAQQRRHVHYSTPEASAPLSPRLVYETAVNHTLRSPSNGSPHIPSMSQHSSATPPTTDAVVGQPLPVDEGQNHDRMETDMESDESSTEGGASELSDRAAESSLMEVEPPEEGEIMDTRPDSVTPEAPLIIAGERVAAAAAVGASTVGNPDLVRISSNGSSVDSNADDLTLADVVVASIIDPIGVSAPTLTPPHLPIDGANPTNTPSQPATDLDAGIQAAVGRADEHDSQDEDSEEEDIPYWANLKEDDSVPDAQELKEIEDTVHETSAVNHDHWERITYEPLDDPEYIPGESGRISWIVQGVNGTPEKPNKEILMRSPSVLIGGYYWNIKYYPRGDEGTQYMSVFVECSTTPCKDTKIKETGTQPSVQETANTGRSLGQATEEHSSSSDISDLATQMTAEGTPPSSDASALHVEAEPALLAAAARKDNVSKVEKQWGVAAQVGCVVYNPEEPRVHASQTSSHHFCNEYSDYGWIRFHGPWDEIHKRQRYQRRALLRNDTLVFTAYIRIVRDNTRALWWHAPKDTLRWDSLARTGLRQFTTGALNSSAFISAISAWLNIGSIADLVLNMHIPDPVEEPRSRPRPLFLALQHVLFDYYNERKPREPESSLDDVIRTMDWYGAELDSKMDVVVIWEAMHRILSYEASNTVTIADAEDLFSNVLMLKQPDPWKDEQPMIDGSVAVSSSRSARPTEPRSVQEAFDLAITGQPDALRVWKPDEENSTDLPSVIQVELHRQSYNKELRQWKKLTHQIKINDTLTLNSSASDKKLDYALKGMIVHSGDLESKKYSAIIRRPQEEGADWVKFAGEQEEKCVTYLTRKQAITSHEGLGDLGAGNSAVAYIVVYERMDSPLRILLTSATRPKDAEPGQNLDLGLGESSESTSDQRLIASENPKTMTLSVYIYPSTSFVNHIGRGFLDAGYWPGREAYEIKMLTTMTVGELRECILGQLHKEKVGRIRLWALDLGTSFTRGSPMFLPPNSKQWASLKLEEFARNVGGCHFWLHRLPEVVEESSTNTSEEAPRPRDEGQIIEVQLPEGAGSSPVIDGEQTQSGDQAAGGTPENEDVVMDGAPDSAAQNPVTTPVTTPPGPHSPEEDEAEAYIFVKVFNHQDQTLRGKGSYVVERKVKVKDTIRKILGPDCPEGIDVYQEQYLTLSDDDLVHPNQTFADVDACDGEIFVAHARPSAAEISCLDTTGACPTPIPYFQYLRCHSSPSLALPHLTTSYFSSPYASCTLRSGRPHGPGTTISLAGDAYTGTFTAGLKSGHGTMAFANGDTYTGQWADDEPNGQGKMVYAGSGNTYTGGFRKRKRHGKGTMVFEVADEEMQLCKICYEMEMDALFYDCGHMAACVECARQVSSCPVCRKGVRAVVKVWKTW